jgi:hypothetical protein
MKNIKQEVVDARVHKQWTYSMIFEEYGIPKSTAQGWVSRYEAGDQLEEVPLATPYVQDNYQRVREKFDRKSEDAIMEFLSQLAPIKVESSYQPNNDYNLNDYAVVGSDFHFGCHDERAINIFLQTVEDLKPKVVVLNGDTMDMLAISRYPKDIKKHWSLQDERVAYHTFLDDLIAVSGGAKIYETYSNHSGQSIDGRWRRYLSERLGELASMPDITEKLSYENIFMGEYADVVEHVDFVELNGLVVTHGTTVRAAGGASAKGEIEKWQTSIMHGHTHRSGFCAKRVPSVGSRVEAQHYGFEGGCLCSLDAVYSAAPNWQQGFNIVSLDRDGVSFGVEQVMINSNDGSANISTLGYSIRG